MNKTNERQAYQCPKINVIPINLSNSFASEGGSGLNTSINDWGKNDSLDGDAE